MCAIVGSFDKDKLIELIKINSYRGSHSFSFSTYDQAGELKIHQRTIGVINPSDIHIPEGSYGIVHIQAPTTAEKTLGSVHPAEQEHKGNTSYLWHNGIIKEAYTREMRVKLHSESKWDTMLMLSCIALYGWDSLDSMDGSFSCLMYKGGALFLFRNEITPMFYDSDMNISSTKFENAVQTNANMVYMLDVHHRALEELHKFNTVENPYYFAV